MAHPQRDRVGTVLVLAAVAVLVFAALRPTANTVRGPAAAGPEAEARRQTDRLDADIDAARRRGEEKTAAAWAVLHGNIGLREAADRFRRISAADPTALARLRVVWPGAPDAELWCRNVIAHVRGLLAERPGLDPDLPARLEAELTAAGPGVPPPAVTARAGP